MKEIEVTTAQRHVTTARRVGNWITFTCPVCGYVRTMNESTRETQVVKQGDPEALHSGMSYPVGIDPEYPMS